VCGQVHTAASVISTARRGAKVRTARRKWFVHVDGIRRPRCGRMGHDVGQMKFNHIGIPTVHSFDGEIPLPHLKLTVSDHQNNPFGVQWQGYWDDAPYPALVKTVAHVAFEVDDLLEAIEGQRVIIEPNSPSRGVMVAFIEVKRRARRAVADRPRRPPRPLTPETMAILSAAERRRLRARGAVRALVGAAPPPGRPCPGLFKPATRQKAFGRVPGRHRGSRGHAR
jgi:hypothetical protein